MIPIRIDRDQWGEITESLMRNKTRAFLTAFGIFWGIFMLLLLMGGGKGMENMLSSNFAGFASNSGFMFSQQTSKPYQGFRKGRWWSIQVPDVERVRHAVPEADVVTPTVRIWGRTAVNDAHSCNISICGQYPEYDRVDNPKLVYGRGISEVDIAQRRKVCVIGSRIHQELFTPTENPCGKTFQIDGIYYTVVGVSGKTEGGMSLGGNASTTVLMPYTTLQQAYNIGSRVDILCLTARSGYDMGQVQKKAEAVLKRAHRIHPDDKQAVNMVNAEAMFSMMDELFGGIGILVWMIGVGTLLSGVIGVSNIMVVTVKERTTEIGIRRAIGATPADIIFMVMSESVVLTLLAGMSGITMAVLLLHGVDQIYTQMNPTAEPNSFQITFSTALAAAGTLSFLGVLAGLAPAYRAMRIKPVDAMREE